MGVSFEDVWPEVDAEWVEAVRSMDWNRFSSPEVNVTRGAATNGTNAQATPQVTEDAALIVEKMWRTRKWGAAYVGLEQMQKHTHLDRRRLFSAVEELVAKGILSPHGQNGPYSLDSSRRGDIEAIANWTVSRRTHKSLS